MAIIQDDVKSSNPFSGWEVIENVSRPTETEAIHNLFRIYNARRRARWLKLTPLHELIMKLEVDCWRFNKHYSTSNPHDCELVYEYVGFHAGILMRDERGRVIADTFAVESLLAEASAICYLQEFGVVFEDDEAEVKAA